MVVFYYVTISSLFLLDGGIPPGQLVPPPDKQRHGPGPGLEGPMQVQQQRVDNNLMFLSTTKSYLRSGSSTDKNEDRAMKGHGRSIEISKERIRQREKRERYLGNDHTCIIGNGKSELYTLLQALTE
ncbi:hypothetical protein V2J09_008663 [Rumex salicifolius]